MIYANRGEKSIGRPEVLSLSVSIRNGATMGSVKRDKKALIGCIGSITQESRELIIIAPERILKNQITLMTICLKIKLGPNKILPPNHRFFYLLK